MLGFVFFLRIVEMGWEGLRSAAREQTKASHVKARWTTKRANEETHCLEVLLKIERYKQSCHQLQPFRHSI